MALKNNTNGAELIESRAQVLARTYTSAYNSLLRQFRALDASDFQKARARQVMRSVEVTIQLLDKETQKWIGAEIPTMYKKFGTEAQTDLQKMGLLTKRAFSQIHVEATQQLADETYLRFANALTGLKRSAQEVLSVGEKARIREMIGEGQITGAATQKIEGDVKNYLEEKGFTAFVDRGGKRWELDRYAETLARNALGNAGRSGTANVIRENGFDLVRITTHGAKDECAFWEGKVISLSGETPGFPTLDEAANTGEIFHVNCRHSYFAVPPWEAEKLINQKFPAASKANQLSIGV